MVLNTETVDTIKGAITTAFIAFVLAFSAYALVGACQFSYADDPNATDSGYTDALTGGGKPWSSDVITDNPDYDAEKGKDPESIVEIFNDLGMKFGGFMIVCLFLIALVRPAWRGIYEMIGRQNSRNFSVPHFLMTGDERQTGQTSTEWVLPMFKETFIYTGLALFIFVILGVLVAVVLFALNSVNPGL